MNGGQQHTKRAPNGEETEAILDLFGKRTNPAPIRITTLRPRYHAIARLLALGCKPKEVMQRFNISRPTLNKIMRSSEGAHEIQRTMDETRSKLVDAEVMLTNLAPIAVEELESQLLDSDTSPQALNRRKDISFKILERTRYGSVDAPKILNLNVDNRSYTQSQTQIMADVMKLIKNA